MKKQLLAVFITSLLGSTNSYALSSGAIANELISTRQFGQGAATTAAGYLDPIAVYSNPAVIGDNGTEATAGAYYLHYTVQHERSGVKTTMDSQNQLIPNAGYTQSLADGKFGWGLAIVSPYGLATDWNPTSNLRYVATNSQLRMLDITPGVSFRPSEKFSVGAGIDYYHVTTAILEKKVSNDVLNFLLGVPTLGAGDISQRLSGDGSQWGYHTGVTYSLSERHSFGAVYHNEVKTELEGDLELSNIVGAGAVAFGGSTFKTPVKADIIFPQNVQFGYAFNPNDKWQFSVDTAWYDWSANQEVLPRTDSATAGQQSILEVGTPLQWKDVWSFAVGTSFTPSETCQYYGGAYFLPSAVPDSTFSPILPQSDRIGLSIGTSITKGGLTFDLSYSPIFYQDRSVTNTYGQTLSGLAAADVSGDYSATIHAAGLNVAYKFN